MAFGFIAWNPPGYSDNQPLTVSEGSFEVSCHSIASRIFAVKADKSPVLYSHTIEWGLLSRLANLVDYSCPCDSVAVGRCGR